MFSDFVGKTPYAGMFQTITPQLLLIDPAMVKNVLISNFKNFSENEFSVFVSANKFVCISSLKIEKGFKYFLG